MEISPTKSIITNVQGDSSVEPDYSPEARVAEAGPAPAEAAEHARGDGLGPGRPEQGLHQFPEQQEEGAAGGGALHGDRAGEPDPAREDIEHNGEEGVRLGRAAGRVAELQLPAETVVRDRGAERADPAADRGPEEPVRLGEAAEGLGAQPGQHRQAGGLPDQSGLGEGQAPGGAAGQLEGLSPAPEGHAVLRPGDDPGGGAAGGAEPGDRGAGGGPRGPHGHQHPEGGGRPLRQARVRGQSRGALLAAQVPARGAHPREKKTVTCINKAAYRASRWAANIYIIMKVDRTLKRQQQDLFDHSVGIPLLQVSRPRVGFLINARPYVYEAEERREANGLYCYFQDEEGKVFSAILPFRPYFYVLLEEEGERDIISELQRDSRVSGIRFVDKLDLDLPGHLSGLSRKCLRVEFASMGALNQTRNTIREMLKRANNNKNSYRRVKAREDFLIDMREHDVMLSARAAIDSGLRVGKWYEVSFGQGVISKLVDLRIDSRPAIKVLAFDIETSKKPLRFPDAETDEVMMISLREHRQAYLIVNRAFCGQDVPPFQYAPREKAEFATEVLTYNEASEKDTLLRFFDLVRSLGTKVITSFNGDRFDWPFIEKRCQVLGLELSQCGVFREEEQFFGRSVVHLDCFYWVERDAYLPQGSHGLKAVCRAKLDYEPVEIDPEAMTDLCRNQTAKMAEYAVSDAVATYFLYMKHIHDFIFALCTIIPLPPDDVLRRGSGTLCEHLLMAEAYSRNILFPNKVIEQKENFYEGHLLDSETYIGGRVECLQAGVFRKDIPAKFDLSPAAYQRLIDEFDKLLEFAVRAESKGRFGRQDIANQAELEADVIGRLQRFRDSPKGEMLPLIYHLDVAAMYPNIILTNRLQPVSIVSEVDCSRCLFNSPENRCKRQMEWQWRGEYFPLKRSEYEELKNQAEKERVSKRLSREGEIWSHFQETEEEQKGLRKRVKEYCQREYKCQHVTKVTLKKDTVCMRENSFYVDTVRAFRDRRYEFKTKVKVEKGKLGKCKEAGDEAGAEQAERMMGVYESLQLAHKIILNSFYGYVMRKGARWYSMEMAAMVTHVGSAIISEAKQWVSSIGLPLELDTDGIWLLLPEGFPQTMRVQLRGGAPLTLSYPCHVLNLLIHEKYKNTQYQQLVDEQRLLYSTSTEMSIEFEIDGPYRAMIIPAAKEQGKMLKKRYVVFKDSGKISELKGFEIKRRGELKIIKLFQEEIFSDFLKGSTLAELYGHCCETARKWIGLVTREGCERYSEEELLVYLEESRVLSKDIEEYDQARGLALTTARRLDEFLGGGFVAGRGKGIKCEYVISRFPEGTPVAERAIPKLIFSGEKAHRDQFLRKWLKKDGPMIQFRNLIDWNYYFERIATQVQKIIVIPAYFQNVPISLPEVPPPAWIIKARSQGKNQTKLNAFTNFFVQKAEPKPAAPEPEEPAGLLTPIKLLSQGEPVAKENQLGSQPQNPFDPRQQFGKWLQTQKGIWSKPGTGGSLVDIFRQQDRQIFSGRWQIVQVVETSPGEFKLWITFRDRLIAVDLEVPREVFEAAQAGTKLRKAPRDRAQNLVRWELAEREFQRDLLKFECANMPGHQFYELKVPLEFRVISRLGNCCLVAGGAERKRLKLSDLREVQSEGSHYLSCLNRLPLIQVLGVRLLANQLWLLIDRRRKQISVGLVFRMGERQITPKRVRQVLQLPDDSFSVSIVTYPTLQACLADVDKALSASTALVLWSSFLSVQDARLLGCVSLNHSCPVVTVEECEQVEVSLLDWQIKGLQALAVHEGCLSAFLQERLESARYNLIPLGNLRDPLHSLDVLFSRVLSRNSAIWWFEEFKKEDAAQLLEGEQPRLQLVNPGFYNYVCVELDVNLLAINALYFAEKFCQDLKTGRLVSKTKGVPAQPDSLDSVKSAFRFLCLMVKQLLDDVDKKYSVPADVAVQNLNRWLADPKRPFHDPLLQRTVQKVYKRCFYQLMGQLQKLNVQIIQADMYKLVFTSGHLSGEEAEAGYKRVFEDCVRKQDCFRFIYCRISSLKQCHLQAQYGNFCGIDLDGEYYSEFDLLRPLPLQVQHTVKSFLLKYCEDMLAIRLASNPRLKDYRALYTASALAYLTDNLEPHLFKVLEKLTGEFEKVEQLLKYGEEEEQSEEEQEDSADSFVVEEGLPRKSGKQSALEEWKFDPLFRHKLLTGDGPLEFVKFLFQLFKVDESFDEIATGLEKLRQRLVRQLDRDPVSCSEVFRWERRRVDVFCAQCYCNFQVVLGTSTDSCPFCKSAIDSSELGLKVRKQVVDEVVLWQVQDLYCRKCGAIRRGPLEQQCKCGGEFVFRRQLQPDWFGYNREDEVVQQLILALGLQ